MKCIQIILAILLFLCLAPMPYGYYILVRYVSMVIFGLTAYQYIQKNKTALVVTFGALAVLFQPFFKVALGRVVWNIVDVLVAIFLIVLWVKDRKEES